MILDKELELTSGTPIDLGADYPGKGEPIMFALSGVTSNVVLTTGPILANAGAMQLATIPAGSSSFTLPSGARRFITATFTGGNVSIAMDAQTNMVEATAGGGDS